MGRFIILIIILSSSFGVFMNALLFPSSPPSWKIAFRVLFRPYLLLFGEMGLGSYERKCQFYYLIVDQRNTH